MKRLALCLLPLCLLVAAASLPARASKPPHFNIIVVNHFTNASGVSQSQEFIQEFSMGLRNALRKWKIAQQVLDETAAVTDADAANSISIDGKFTGLDNGAIFTKLRMEIEIYRISDHVLVMTVAMHDNYFHHGDSGNSMGDAMSGDVALALEKVNLSAIPAGPTVPRPTPTAAAPAPSSAAIAQPAAPALASIQFSSNPAGAEITIDGAYAGNTPSLIKLRPGTHSIRITKSGYTPWERSTNISAGESRTIAAALEKTSQ
ncbi:MAG: PEGA domain-containing protein [Terracidiphilus sp.]